MGIYLRPKRSLALVCLVHVIARALYLVPRATRVVAPCPNGKPGVCGTNYCDSRVCDMAGPFVMPTALILELEDGSELLF